MKMRLPEPTNPETPAETSAGLPLWQRPLVEVMRDAGLATVTSLPRQPRAEEAIDEDLENAELARTIQMPGVWMSQPVIDIDRDELHLPRLATSEAEGLASGTLRSDHFREHVTHDHVHVADDNSVINLDDVAVDAEIVFDGPSADALLERWSEDVTADVHDRQEKVDGLYRRMVDATQQPRITFGPIDLRDEIAPPRAEARRRCCTNRPRPQSRCPAPTASTRALSAARWPASTSTIRCEAAST